MIDAQPCTAKVEQSGATPPHGMEQISPECAKNGGGSAEV